ncbi:FkbM family methyltransferase [Synechocystis salina LEGE 06155]|nr:FkbM family methyltransferase [Synechocystis salina LEGE 06155]
MIKQLLKNNRIVQRIKVLKDLFLQKLDDLQASVDQIKITTDQNLEEIRLELEQKNRNINQILENQIFLIKSALDTARTIKYLVESGQQRQIIVEQMINAIHQEFQRIREESERSNGYIHQEFQNIRSESQQRYQLLHQEFQAVLGNLQHYQEILIDKFLDLQENSQQQDVFLRETLAQIAADVHDQKFKVVTDPSYFQAIDIELMVYLYSYLPHRRAIDVGANRGDVSARLLQTGYEVYAFEPFPPVLAKLQERLGQNNNFHAFGYALGAANETRNLHLVVDQTEDKIFDDASLYSSLTRHSLTEGLVFHDSITVEVKTIASLHEAGTLPDDIGLVKIDTEGFDLEVIKGMGNFRYPVVLAEFWDTTFPFGQTGAMNHLADMVPAMRQRDYRWHIIIYRIWGQHEVSYYCNSNYSLENSWGNVFFFQDYEIFSQALKWCNSVMPATYFAV